MAENVLQIVKDVIWAKSNEESQKIYDVWSKNYDEHIRVVGRQLHLQTAMVFKEHTKNMDVSKVLDLGAGTGMVGEYLREVAQYKGDIDILDANMELLYVASKKPIVFRNIIRHWVSDQLPVRDHGYDVIICIGCFLPNHISVSSLPAILRAVKPGGLLLFNLRAQTTEEYRVEFDTMILKLINEGKLSLLNQTEIGHIDSRDEKVNLNVFLYRCT